MARVYIYIYDIMPYKVSYIYRPHGGDKLLAIDYFACRMDYLYTQGMRWWILRLHSFFLSLVVKLNKQIRNDNSPNGNSNRKKRSYQMAGQPFLPVSPTMLSFRFCSSLFVPPKARPQKPHFLSNISPYHDVALTDLLEIP